MFLQFEGKLCKARTLAIQNGLGDGPLCTNGLKQLAKFPLKAHSLVAPSFHPPITKSNVWGAEAEAGEPREDGD